MFLDDNQIRVRIKVHKTKGTVQVEILEHGEKVDCTVLDADGESINKKITEYLRNRVQGNGMGDEAQLNARGYKEVETKRMNERQGSITAPPDDIEEVFDPLASSDTGGKVFDTGFGV